MLFPRHGMLFKKIYAFGYSFAKIKSLPRGTFQTINFKITPSSQLTLLSSLLSFTGEYYVGSHNCLTFYFCLSVSELTLVLFTPMQQL